VKKFALILFTLGFLGHSFCAGSAGATAGGTGRELIVSGLMYDLGPILQAKTIDLTLLSDMQKLLYLGGYSDNVVAVEAMLLTLGGLDQTSLPITYELCLLYDLPAKLQLLIDAIDYFKKLYFMNQLQGLLANPEVKLDSGERMNFSIGLEEGDYIALITRIYGYLKDKILNIGYQSVENMAILEQVLAELLPPEAGKESISVPEVGPEEDIEEPEFKQEYESKDLKINPGDYIDKELTEEEIALMFAVDEHGPLSFENERKSGPEVDPEDESEGVEESKSFEKIDENNLVELERFLYELPDPEIRYDYAKLLAEDFDIKKVSYLSIVGL
jgi:hypothetical protein